MKCLLVLIPFLFGCSIYQDYRIITISGLSEGFVIITSDSYFNEFYNKDKNEIDFKFNKGEKYFISFYPIISGVKSRYPLGAIIDCTIFFVTLSPHLGPVSEICNHLNQNHEIISPENLKSLISVLNVTDDPWIFDKSDLILYLLAEISYGSITKYKTYTIRELDFLFTWESENRLFNKWYESVQFFYNEENNFFYRLEIYKDGTYSGFVQVN